MPRSAAKADDVQRQRGPKRPSNNAGSPERRGRRVRQPPPKVWLNPDLFPNAERPEADAQKPATPAVVEPKEATREKRIVAAVAQPADPKTEERARLLAKLLHAEGRPAITRAVDDFEKAGHTWPVDDQNVFVQMLEHDRDDRVLQGLDALASLLRDEAPKRPAVLDARLRRLESFAEEEEIRASAAKLRRQIAHAGR